MKHDFYKVSSKENSVQKYMLTTYIGETLYVYWKIVYDKVTEPFLKKEFNIKSDDLSKNELKVNHEMNSSDRSM